MTGSQIWRRVGQWTTSGQQRPIGGDRAASYWEGMLYIFFHLTEKNNKHIQLCKYIFKA